MKQVGDPGKVLGPIPSHEEIQQSLKEVEMETEQEAKATERIAHKVAESGKLAPS